MKKTAYILIILGVSIFLFYVAVSRTNDHSSAGFKRVSKGAEPIMIKSHQFSYPIRFLWEPEEEIFLVNSQSSIPYKIDYSLNKLKQFSIKTPSGFNDSSRTITFDKNDSVIFMTDAKRNIGVTCGDHSINYRMDSLVFDVVKGLSPNSVITRGWDFHVNGTRETVLSKIRLSKTKGGTVRKKYVLPKQVDGFFCSDGKIHYDKKHALIFYLFYHRGEFICLDTNLNLVYKAKTIDTVTQAKIKFGEYQTKIVNNKTTKFRKLAERLEMVNKCIATDSDKIYLLSNLKAENDSLKNESIDVYSIRNGRYLYSFYLPRIMRFRLKNFKVNYPLIATIYDKYLVTFKIRQ